jgi:DNA-binding NarL/FixJ family response regulator
MVIPLVLAHDKQTLCDPRISRTLFKGPDYRGTSLAPPAAAVLLTPGEMDIARLVGHGATNTDIAVELHLAMATIKNHVHSIL